MSMFVLSYKGRIIDIWSIFSGKKKETSKISSKGGKENSDGLCSQSITIPNSNCILHAGSFSTSMLK